jgi:hypothetical protein
VIRTATRLTLLLLPALLGLLVTAGAASAKSPCWKLLVNDWYDGRIDKIYPIACYREALKHLPTDIREYSSAFDDINRALAARIASTSAATAKKQQPPKQTQPTQTTPAQTTPTRPTETNQTAAAPPAKADPPPPPPPAHPKPKPKPTNPNPPSATTTPTETAATPPVVPAKPAAPKPKPAAKPVTPPPPPPTQGRQGNGGVVGSALQDIGSDSADSLPIPLLVLGSLAILLLLLGTAGFVARRLKARKADIRPGPQAR